MQGAMFGKYQAVFRSRWRALFWASGVLLTAYCTVPSQDESDDDAGLAAIMGEQSGDHAPHKHVNPWALRK
jgi:hypothetical protein